MNYDDWNRAITKAFFNPNQAQTPVYLHVDDEILEDIAKQLDLPVESARQTFVQAVLSRVRFRDSRSQPFFKFLQWRAWDRQLKIDPTTPPPFVAFLGFCVLAAGNMTADETLNVTSSNYYVRLNKLLGNAGQGCPTGFEAIDRAWKRLNQWLQDDLQGACGLPTANNEQYGRHVGYPISQAVMRRTDLEELPGFFRWCGLEPGEETVDLQYFQQQLQIWAARTTCSFSSQLRHVFERGQQHYIEQITAITQANFKTWDGNITTHHGGRTAEIIIQLNRAGRGFELALHPKAPEDFPEGEYGHIQLFRSDDPDWFEPLGERHVQDWLSGNAIDLQQERYRIYLGAKRLVPLRSDLNSDLGGWISCSRVGLGEQHLILCSKELKDQVESYLQQFAKGGWRIMVSRDPIYADWVCFGNIRITRYTQDHHGELDCLVPMHRIGIRLSSGLKLKRDVWLQGGEPEAIVSVDNETPVYLDDTKIRTAVPGSTIINLRHHNLSEGTHSIRVGSHKRNFAISCSGNELLGQHRMQLWGYPFQRAGETQFKPLSLTAEALPALETIPSGRLYIAGIHIIHSADDPTPARQHLIILPYGARAYIILGRRIGEVLQPQLPSSVPEWQASSYLLGCKQTVPFDPQWLITISHRNNITLRPIGLPKEALKTIVSKECAKEWIRWASNRKFFRRLSKKNKQYSKLWIQYSEVARGAR